MDRKEVLQQLTPLFLDVLDLEALTLTEETTAKDIDEWDSLTHIQLVVAFEKHFNIRFTSTEIQSWKNIGEIIDTILTKK